MQTVTDRWYVIYTRSMLGLAGLFLVLSLVSLFVPPAEVLQHWGFSYITIFLPILSVVYYFSLYRRQVAKGSLYSATMIMSLMLTLTVLSLMNGSGQLHSGFLVLWYGVVFMAGMFGTYALGGYAFLMACYFIMITNSSAQASHDFIAIGAVIVTWGLCVVGHFVWQSQYINRESIQINEMSQLLKSKQLQSEALIQAIAEGVIVIDTDGKILLMNPAAATMVDWVLTEAIGLNIRTVMVFNDEKGQPLAESANPFEQVSAITTPTTRTINLVSKKGTSRVVSLVISPVIQPGSQQVAAVIAVFRDVTVTRAEEQRRADFISTASHEMRTPVAAIEGYLALALNEHVSKIDAKARDYLEKAHASAEHLGKLFQDLLTSAKAEDGRLVSHPEVIEMGAYLEQLTDSLKFAAQKKGLLTDFTIGTSSGGSGGERVVRPLYYTLADPDRLREVITNLFDNAVKYSDTGKISIGLTGNNNVVQFYIRDTGHGIPKEDIPHLFQKFYRVDNSATRTIGGNGLGLFICRKIVELYNGRIWVDSEYGKGSTFYINLPRLSSSRAVELQKQQTAGQELAITK